MSAIVPIPRVPIDVRVATMADLAFIDSLQRLHTKMVGWMPTKQLESKIAAGHVLVAEEGPSTGSGQPASRVGYCISQDRYFKRDDVGIIYQLNVMPGRQRSLIGASLIKAVFERAAYGCKLFCLWCAQDIEANYFWESLGFVPIAFRTGARGRQGEARTHIFWQRRVREGDTITPYWFPAKTDSGSLREDRLVLPIPPGVRWCDAMPVVLPEQSGVEGLALSGVEGPGQSGKALAPPREAKAPRRKRVEARAQQAPKRLRLGVGLLRFADAALPQETRVQRKPKRRPPKAKCDPAHVAAARELRDRWLEQFNSAPLLSGGAAGKYEVSRAALAALANRWVRPLLHEMR